MTGASKYLDCSKCSMCATQRAHSRCGYVASDKHEGYAPTPSEYEGPRPDICPGYLITQPAVIEAVRANGWREKGALSQFYDGQPLTQLTKNAIDVVAASQREVENYNIRNPAGVE